LVLNERTPAKNPFNEDFPSNYTTGSKLMDKIVLDEDTESEEEIDI